MTLPAVWRAELARQGFHDIEKPDGTIEDGRAPLTRHSSDRWNAEEYDALAEYYCATCRPKSDQSSRQEGSSTDFTFCL